MKIYSALIISTLLVTACTDQPKEAYYDRARPESLLDVSSEVVNVRLDSDTSINQITRWVNQDQPSRAELSCVESDRLCAKARKVLQQFGVPVMQAANGNNEVALVYERIAARDCEPRFIDNHINPYRLNHPTFGCSIASNSVQMISDKQQLVSPVLLDYPEAEKAAQVYKAHMQPTGFKPADASADFQPSLGQNLKQD